MAETIYPILHKSFKMRCKWHKIIIFAKVMIPMFVQIKSFRLPINLLFAITALVFSCANPVAPTGGPKDETPPAITRTTPGNQSTNFSSDRFSLSFTEFVTLKDISNQLIVSPPLGKQPEFLQKGKTLLCRFKEPLRDNTTYNIFFGNAIVDITESNPLAGYRYTFATGPVIDSMQMSGVLTNAFTNQPVKGAFVMLYDSIYDSIPYKSRPYYLTRTSDNGEFSLNNLRDGRYLMFALQDGNADYLYNQPNEDIAFTDSLVIPILPPRKVQDSTSKSDSSAILIPQGKGIQLRLFHETDSVQKLSKSSLLRERVVSLVYRYPVKKFSLSAGLPSKDERVIVLFNPTHDSLQLWFPDITSDSIRMIAADSGRTSDTIEMGIKPRVSPTARTKGKSTVVSNALNIKNNITGARLRPDRPLIISFADPLKHAHIDQLRFRADTVMIKPEMKFTDTLQMQLLVNYPWKEGVTYSVTISDSVFTNIFGSTNDSVAFRFTPYTESETSMLSLNIQVALQNTSYIIQLLGEKDKVLTQQTITGDTKITYKYLSPGKYRLKVIYDNNGNGYWDTGKYLLKRQPEYVAFHPKVFELRANWTLEEDWFISLPSAP